MAKEGPVPWASDDQVTFIAEQTSHHPPSMTIDERANDWSRLCCSCDLLRRVSSQTYSNRRLPLDEIEVSRPLRRCAQDRRRNVDSARSRRTLCDDLSQRLRPVNTLSSLRVVRTTSHSMSLVRSWASLGSKWAVRSPSIVRRLATRQASNFSPRYVVRDRYLVFTRLAYPPRTF